MPSSILVADASVCTLSTRLIRTCIVLLYSPFSSFDNILPSDSYYHPTIRPKCGTTIPESIEYYHPTMHPTVKPPSPASPIMSVTNSHAHAFGCHAWSEVNLPTQWWAQPTSEAGGQLFQRSLLFGPLPACHPSPKSSVGPVVVTGTSCHCWSLIGSLVRLHTIHKLLRIYEQHGMLALSKPYVCTTTGADHKY
jgi:hypothetical protein